MENYNIPKLNLSESFSRQDQAWSDAVRQYEKQNRGRKFRDLPEQEQQKRFMRSLQQYGLTMNSKGYIVTAGKENKGTPMNESVKALAEHVKKQVPLCDSIFRYQSEAYFDTFKTAKKLREAGSLPELDWESEEMLGTDIGESVELKGVGRVWLDVPYLNEGQDPEPKQEIVDKFARTDAKTRTWYIGQWAERKGIDTDDAMHMAGYIKDGYMGSGAWNWRYVGMGESVEETVRDSDYMDFQDMYMQYLHALRKSGKINMFGAPKELQREFGLSKEQSYEVFNNWKDSFNEASFDQNAFDEGMIGQPDNFYDAEARKQAYNDLQDALEQSSSVEAEYVKDGSCPECPNVEDDEDCYGFGNYGCDDGILTYDGGDVSWKEIKDHDERQAQRQQAKANYPDDEAVIQQAAKMMPNMDDPRMIVRQIQTDYPQLGRAKASDLAGKAKQIAFPESVEIDQIKNLAGLNELKDIKDERTDIDKIADLLKDAIGPGSRGEDMYELYAELESMDSEKADEIKLIAKELYGVRLEEGKSPHKKGSKKYKKHMAAMHAEDLEERKWADDERAGTAQTQKSQRYSDGEKFYKDYKFDPVTQIFKSVDGSEAHISTPLGKELRRKRARDMARTTPSAQARRKSKVMASEAVSANMQSMFNDLRIDDDTYISDGNKELTPAEVGPGFYLLGYDRSGRCFEMSKTSQQNAKDNITGYGEYKVSDADITDFDGARYYYNDNMPDGGVLNIKEAANEAEYQGKDVELNKPKRGGSKKYYVYVKTPKGNVKKISFGDVTGLKAKAGNKKAAKSFAARHNCEKKNDKQKAGYWACRLPRYGLVKGGKWW